MTAANDPAGNELEWHRVAQPQDVPEGRVTTVSAGRYTICLTHFDGQFAALDNHCTHQGGPLGEGSIEKGWLRCPWHGYDFNPLDGTPPGGFDDGVPTYALEVRDDGIYVGVPAEPPHEETVSDVLVRTMVNWGINTVFGMVGHSNLGFADALRRAEKRGDLRYIGIRHEGAAAFAASAYGKLTGRPAACFGIAGPGSTNLLTGLYDAKVDRSPVLALSGQVPSKVLGRGAFQDLRLEGAFADVAAYSRVVLNGSDPAELMSLACKTAIVERDVGHLILPDEVQVLPCPTKPTGPDGRLADQTVPPPAAALAAAQELISGAVRPVFVVGHGARGAMDDIVSLAERLNAPVLTTFKAKGAISDHHPLGAGVLGRSGTPVASWFMNESDLMVVFGASFSNHTGIADYKPLIQVDRDPMALGRFHPVTVPVLADVATAARTLLAGIDPAHTTVDQRSELAGRWRIWREEKDRRVADDRGNGLPAAALFAAMTRQVDPDAVICVDVGNNTYSFGRYFETTRQAVLMSGYLGSIGFALPAALGAWAAAPERQIVSISGDGGLGQYLAELTTAVKYNMDLTHVVLNNGQLGKISKEQRDAHFDVWQTSLVNPDFAAYAELCGARGWRVESAADLDGALRGALDYAGPALVEVIQDPVLL